MENSYKDMYDNILNNYEEYLKVVDICHNLSMIRINKLIKTFGGNNYENECFYKEIKNDNISYALDIYCDKIDSTSLILHSSKGSDDLERILSENECMYGFSKSEDEDTLYRKFVFPKDEKKLLYITGKIIDLLKKEIE
ncbi:hypothetical protein [Brachyspira murdochii]|uniref:Uncharacterized protein n=2 Tax=Brachyspira murdochii TaxID=84378 RepID=D5U998_BRAM5|nr:hypothetical protein [Brachyspira murdochii]ADG71271.1 hypothetical protein Bmur_1177 [Brachyspira murdochii DSM 12563]PPS22581.1 hypothetical protein DJ52_03980 [Brachyspira murdochii]